MIGNGGKIKTIRTKPRKSDWYDRLEEKKRDQELEKNRRVKREPLDTRHRDNEES